MSSECRPEGVSYALEQHRTERECGIALSTPNNKQRDKMADPGRVFISYRSPHRLYGLCWGTKPNDLRVAASTFIPEEYVNKLQVRGALTEDQRRQCIHHILQPSPDGKELTKTLEIDHPYPPTKVMWSPASSVNPVEYLATTADYLRLWAVSDSSIERHATISNKRNQETCAPLTSFDWNEAEPNIIGTSSIDTTCTIWDLNIIAHDDEVYDIAFSNEASIFGSVGGDGSLRIFDLRCLESSTIMYDSPDLQPLLRIAWNKLEDRYVAAIVAGSPKVVILDLRNTARSVFELNQHTASVNSISWSPHSRFHICSAAEDRTAIIYDISACSTTPDVSHSGNTSFGSMEWNSSVFFRSKRPINQVRWSSTRSNCIALSDEDAAHIVQI